MSYIKVEEYKTFLWITTLTPAQEAQVNMFISMTKSKIDKVIGDISLATRAERVLFSDVYYENWFTTKIHTQKKNITDLISINGTAYTGDYTIDGTHKNILYIKWDFDLWDYKYVELSVSNWYDPIPDDIKLLQSMMVNDMINQTNWGDITKKKIGDKELQFSSNTSQNKKALMDSILSSYIIPYV